MYSHDELFAEVRNLYYRTNKVILYDADKFGRMGKDIYTEDTAKDAAKELVSRLEQGFASAQKHGGLFGDSKPLARITYRIKKETDGTFRVHVVFPAKYLFRESLWKDAAYTERTGSGINDIFSLFTTGYRTSSRMPSGYWESKGRFDVEIGYVHAPNYWAPNSFISDTIEAFEAEYPGIIVEYPDEWHS